VVSSYKKYGQRIAHLGGIDMDFMCRATESEIRERVRFTLEECMKIEILLKLRIHYIPFFIVLLLSGCPTKQPMWMTALILMDKSL
jgi:hypothetical protein